MDRSFLVIILPLLIICVAGAVWFFGFSGDGTTTQPVQTTDAYSTTTPPDSGQGGLPQQLSPEAIQHTQDISGTTNTQQHMTQATLHTNKGDIVIQFDATNAPNTVANFIKLASSGFYDGTKFHRVIKGFMIQGGDPLSKDDSMMARWGTGGPGYQFADEISANNHDVTGTIAMANSGPNTNGSQFFINVADNNFLDTKHTVFGHVTMGMDVVHAIENTQTGANDRPIEPMVITSIALQ
ncbi:MAG TPA: peptidylprolyl isomerase [Candidatus Paceibacterota bacterium]|nr:peptidylprolyl isomerase [Candidatus Paceibacterota bacterium]